MDDRGKKNMEVDRFRLIDVSSEDDCLIDSPCGFTENQKEHDCSELFEVDNAQDMKDASDFVRQRVQEPMFSESLEQERTIKIGKCNLRKSLAWDSAFFTCAGVLDPEELSIINNGMKKADRHLLPGIQEDIRRSAESNSTFDSDNLILESLEGDLFEDIRASIQRSSQASNVASSSGKAGPGDSGMQSLCCKYTAASINVSASKKMEIASRNRMKPMVASKRQSICMQGSEKTTKEALVRPRAVQPTARSGQPNSSSLKPPKILGRANPISATPTKRASLGVNRVKVENSTAKTAKVAGKGVPVVMSKKPGLGDPSVTPRPTPSPKSSSSGSPFATKIESIASCSSYNRSGSTSSDSSGKCPLKNLRNKTDSRNVNPASDSTLKTPLRTSSRNKIESANPRLSAYLMSLSKLSSNISPASSIDGWSTESSSSTSTVNQRSNSSKASLDISSPHRGFSLERDAPQASDLQNCPRGQPCVDYESQGARLLSQCAKRTSLGTGALSHPATANVSKSFKPTGLRMPSPKIGFFDAEKSVARTPNGSSPFHSGARSGLPKNGAGISNLNCGASKTKPVKLQPGRTVTGTSSVKTDSHKAVVLHSASSMRSTSLAQHQELSNASPKVSGTLRARENCPGITSKVQNDLSQTGRKNHWKTWDVGEVPDTDRGGLGYVLNAEENGGQDAFKNNVGTESEEEQVHLRAIEITPIKENGFQISSKASSDFNCDNTNPSNKSGQQHIYGQGNLENNLHSLQKSNEKENSFCFEFQVDDLSRNLKAVDVNMDTVKEVIEKKNSSLSQFDVNKTYNPGDPKLASSHGPEDFLKISSQPSPLSLSSNTMDIIPSMRTPLSVKVSCGSRSGSLELASESTMEKAFTFPFPEGTKKESS